MVFMLAGFLLEKTALLDLQSTGVKPAAEATLALLLFHGAAELRPKDFRRESLLVGRLLFVALPTTMLAIFLLAHHVYGLDVWLALLLAAALVPTDAALAAAMVTNPAVPVRIRRLLNLESGLNDGIATPVVLFALAAAADVSGAPRTGEAALVAVEAIAIGVVFGGLVGLGAGRFLNAARHRGWADVGLVPIAVLAVPLLCYYGADVLSGNGFMAAFVAGTMYATTQAREGEESDGLELARLTSEVLAGAAWLLFGAATATHLGAFLHWQTLLFAILSLTILRMVPVALSLVGSRLGAPSNLFIGWFGPRGLPSVVFALIINEALKGQPGASAVVATIAVTVVISVLSHGLSAAPLSQAYGRWANRSAHPGDAGQA